MSASKDDEWSNRSYPFQEDMRFQRRDWIFERVGWCFLCLVIALAIAGVFSVGPLSDTTAANASLQVEYQRFHRNGALTEMALHINSTDKDIVRLHLNTEFMEAFMIEDMWPQPVLSSGDADGVAFVYDASRSRQFSVYIALRPGKLGSVAAQARLEDQEPVSFNLFVYP